MMTCKDDLIQLYVDGTLHPAESTLVEAHLKACPNCRRRAGFYKALAWDLGQMERIRPEPEFKADELASLLQAEWRRNQSPADRSTTLELSTLWLTANPTLVRPTRVAGDLGHAGLDGLRQAGQKGLTSLGRLLRQRGGGHR